MKKIRVLQSLSSVGIGGNEFFVMNIFRNIDREQFQVDFIIYDDSEMDFYQEIIDAGSKVYVCHTKYRNKLLQVISQIRQVKKVLKYNQYDIIHCNSCSFLGIFKGAIPGHFTKGTKVITHSHNTGTPTNTFFDRFVRKILKEEVCYFCDYGFACSEKAGESKYTKSFMSGNSYTIIHNAIDTKRFSFNEEKRRSIRKHMNIKDSIVIGNVGRLSSQKNQVFLFEILSYLIENDKQAVLLIIGGGELEKELKKQAEDKGISEYVHFTGLVNNVNEYYSAMDVFVMPSLYEGLPFSAVEAQANGLPCVMSDAVTTMVNISGDVFFLSLEESVQKWADIVWEKSTKRSSWEKVEKVRREYDLMSETKRLEKVYMEIMGVNE